MSPTTPTSTYTTDLVNSLKDTILIPEDVTNKETGNDCNQTLNKDAAEQSTRSESKVTEAPNKEDFLVPKDTLEHSEMVDKLIKAGIRQIEADQIIASRKNAYNRACHEYKKNTIPTMMPATKTCSQERKTNPKKSKKSSKPVSPNTTIEHAN